MGVQCTKTQIITHFGGVDVTQFVLTLEQLTSKSFATYCDNSCFYFRSINPALSESILPEERVTFDVVEEGTVRKKKKLVSSDGYSYCVKV